MGWANGTEIFDKVVKSLLEGDEELNSDKSITVIKVLVEALEDRDWDCQYESNYWSHYIIGRILGNDFEEERED